jgi:hypothetical protein
MGILSMVGAVSAPDARAAAIAAESVQGETFAESSIRSCGSDAAPGGGAQAKTPIVIVTAADRRRMSTSSPCP